MQPPERSVVVIGAPLDLGRARVDMGPGDRRRARQHDRLGIVIEDRAA
jgi:hypothetical protein